MKSFFTLLATLGSVGAIACGPFFPTSYFDEDQPRHVVGGLNYELQRLARHYTPEVMRYPVNKTPGLSTADGTRNDAQAAGATEEELATYLAFDKNARQSTNLLAMPDAVPEKLQEFYLYSTGFNELRIDGPAGAPPPSWAKLLALPETQRRFRTTWVLFMLGNSRQDLAERNAYYRQLREAVQAGFIDSLNLFEASYRIQGRQLRYLPAAAFYSNFHTEAELKALLRRAANSRREAMLQDPLERDLLLLWSSLYETPETFTRLVNSLPEGQIFLVAERAALKCYRLGDLANCRKLLRHVPEVSPVRLYLEARFCKRAGDWQGAATKLKQWLQSVSPDAVSQYQFRDDGDFSEVSFFQEVQGSLGAVLAEEKLFSEALHAFWKADDRFDAAALAEHRLSTDALIAFCRTYAVDEQLISTQLRHLLARRLMREYRVREAGEFFPEEMQPAYQYYLQFSTDGNAAGTSKEERALALFNLGNLLRVYGMELRGTEFAPDYHHWYRGNFTQNHRFTPEQDLTWRFHYRVIAAQHFARAAALSDNPELQAAALIGAARLTRRYGLLGDEYFKMLCDLRPFPLAEAAAKAGHPPRNTRFDSLLQSEPEQFRPATADDFVPKTATLFKSNTKPMN